MRKSARETAFKLVFSSLFDTDAQELTDEYIVSINENNGLDPEDFEYIRRVISGITENGLELKKLIEEKLKGYKPERVYKADMAALILAAYELKFMPDVPYKVAINEAVNLVKKYSTENSAGFVNGVLSGIYKDVSNE